LEYQDVFSLKVKTARKTLNQGAFSLIHTSLRGNVPFWFPGALKDARKV
jgi:hypothetical protein